MKIVIKNLNINIYTTSKNLSKDIEQLKEVACNFNQNKNQTCKLKYKPTTKAELEELVNNLNINLRDIDTSLITDMSFLFFCSDREDFFGIEKWDVSNVKRMVSMFCHSEFNQDISNWDTASVSDMDHMFAYTKFNQDISNWKINKNCWMNNMFNECPIKEEFKPHKETEE